MRKIIKDKQNAKLMHTEKMQLTKFPFIFVDAHSTISEKPNDLHMAINIILDLSSCFT